MTKNIKKKEAFNITSNQAKSKIIELQKEYYSLRVKKKFGELATALTELRKIRVEIARLKTFLNNNCGE